MPPPSPAGCGGWKNAGATLFEQTREGQILTQAGERLLAVEQMAQASSALRPAASPSGLTGSVRISVSEGFGSWSWRAIWASWPRYPGLTIDLVASSGSSALTARGGYCRASAPQIGAADRGQTVGLYARLYASPAYLASAAP
jgi:DNA-binding transcriptional LysR family regulator